jgi:hypothetical protein
VGGNVVLTQGENVLKGERLVIDLKTGESRFENPGSTASGGRIRALFMPKGGPAKDAKSDEKSGDGKPDQKDGASDTFGQTFDAGPPDRGVADDGALLEALDHGANGEPADGRIGVGARRMVERLRGGRAPLCGNCLAAWKR